MTRAYPDSPAVDAGGMLRLHVSTDAPRFRVRFFRCGASMVQMGRDNRWRKGQFAPPGAPGVPWNWPIEEFEVPHTWPSGAYVAALDDTPALDARSARALFTVRNKSNAAPLLVVIPLFTYHAYNVADVDGTLGAGEGSCLYSGAPWVSLHRPGGGIGGHPWDEVNADAYDPHTPRQTFAHWDAKALSWLEANGYEYDCATDLQLHDAAFDLDQYRAIASFGHHEYWTQQMRDRIDAFIRGGGNVAFFGGNTCWFRAEYDPQARAIRRAGRWNDNPEWTTTGVSYAYGGGKWIGPRPPSGFTVRDETHWVFEGTGLRNGDCFGAQERLVGYECDGAPPESDLHILADASIQHWPVSDGTGEVSELARASLGIREENGIVFTASTVDWARVLHQNTAVQRITHNVLQRLLAVPDVVALGETRLHPFR